MLAHLDALEWLELSMGENPEQWVEDLAHSRAAPRRRHLSLPSWLDATIRRKIERAVPGCTVEYRRERRSRFNRATGFYIP
jgi:hypothetical protein